MLDVKFDFWCIFLFSWDCRSCTSASFYDNNGPVRMSLLPVSIESISSSTMGSVQHNSHDGRQTRLPSSCYPPTTKCRNDKLGKMERFIRGGSPVQSPLHQPSVVFFNDGRLSYLNDLEFKYQFSLTLYILYIVTHTHTHICQTGFFLFSFSFFVCVLFFFFLFWIKIGDCVSFVFLCVCVCLVCVEKGAVIRRWPCLKIPSSFVSCKNISILKKTNFFRFTCKKIKKNGSKKNSVFFFFSAWGGIDCNTKPLMGKIVDLFFFF